MAPGSRPKRWPTSGQICNSAIKTAATGLAPTAPDVRGKGKEAPPAYALCGLCGQPVLTGQTLDGHTLHLDVGAACYAITWAHKATVPTLLPSRAYPVHRCVAGAGTDEG